MKLITTYQLLLSCLYFFTTKDLYFHIRFEIVELSDTSICTQIFKQKALDISENIETTSKFIQKSCALAQKSQSNQANKHQKNIFHAVGDKIWLCTKNITTNRLFEKLNYKIFNFFKVIGSKRVSVELQLPKFIKIHNIFQPNLLQKVSTNPLTN